MSKLSSPLICVEMDKCAKKPPAVCVYLPRPLQHCTKKFRAEILKLLFFPLTFRLLAPFFSLEGENGRKIECLYKFETSFSLSALKNPATSISFVCQLFFYFLFDNV